MLAISNAPKVQPAESSVTFLGRKSAFRVDCLSKSTTLRPFKYDTFHLYRPPIRHSRRVGNNFSARMTLVDERLARVSDLGRQSGVLAYELVQGALVRWSSLMDKSVRDPPTAVLVHGILGCQKNWMSGLADCPLPRKHAWSTYCNPSKNPPLLNCLVENGTFARRLAQNFPTWQFLLVDLRCHGESAASKKRPPHTVAAAALDVLKLVAQLRIIPRVLVGHSFGGKVVLSMVEQAAKPLPRPVRVWVLDATPGKARPGLHSKDHPLELIATLKKLPKEVASKRAVIDVLRQQGFSKDVAQWVVTNLRRICHPGASSSYLSWVFDLNGIAEMYRSYEETNLWKIVEDVPRGVHVNFLKAERSLHRWALEDIQRIHAAEELAADVGAGVQMHVLEDAGHWVHADNPDGLFRILASSFEGIRT